MACTRVHIKRVRIRLFLNLFITTRKKKSLRVQYSLIYMRLETRVPARVKAF